MKYNELPKDIKNMLFKMHTHGDRVNENDIVYREEDVLELIDCIKSMYLNTLKNLF